MTDLPPATPDTDPLLPLLDEERATVRRNAIAAAAGVVIQALAAMSDPYVQWRQIEDHFTGQGGHVRPDGQVMIHDGQPGGPVPLRTAATHAARHGLLWNNVIDDTDLWGVTDAGRQAWCVAGRPAEPRTLRRAARCALELAALLDAMAEGKRGPVPDQYHDLVGRLAGLVHQAAVASAQVGYTMGPAPLLDGVADATTRRLTS